MVQHAISEANGGQPNTSKTAVVIVAGTSRDAVEAAAYSARANGTCMGSSTRHIVTFDGLDFKLIGNCSYTLFEDKEEGIEVILHNMMQLVPKLNCMNALEVTYQGSSVQLYDNMTNHTLAFTPSNNEFTLQLSPKSFASKIMTPLLVTSLVSSKTGPFGNRGGFARREGLRFVSSTPSSAAASCFPLLLRVPSGHPPNIFYATCEENNCARGTMKCPDSLIYQHCQKGCTKHCENGTNLQVCMDYPTEGCFCPPGQVILDGTCTCMGSSTRHIVTFDGLDFKLIGNCSYTLFEDKEEDIEVILHNGACSSVPKLNCMNALEVTYQGSSVQLYDNMTNHTLAFTPSNNEFTLQLSPRALPQNNDSITRDVTGFIQDWTLWQPGRVCKERRPEVCVEHASRRCSILLSTPFYECHQVIPPNIFYATCEENNCVGEEVCEIIASYAHLCKVHGVCVDWRTPDFCAMKCPDSLIYQHCQKGCTKHCENGTNLQVCMDYPTEGCFCPPGQPLETWIPSTEPCKVCMCLENRTPLTVVPVRFQDSRGIPIICDLISCKLPPVPHCEDGLQLIQTNAGGCRPDYACVCKQEECEPQPTPICPPHRKRILVKTQCCDEFQCVCSCNNSTVTCPPGYLSSCVHNIVYPLGMTWEEDCKECSCTDMKDAVTGLLISECLEKRCSTSCPALDSSRVEGWDKDKQHRCLESTTNLQCGKSTVGQNCHSQHLLIPTESWSSAFHIATVEIKPAKNSSFPGFQEYRFLILFCQPTTVQRGEVTNLISLVEADLAKFVLPHVINMNEDGILRAYENAIFKVHISSCCEAFKHEAGSIATVMKYSCHLERLGARAVTNG
ncbi:hypothetical protein E2320_005937, partial [Naja naja]